MCSIVSRHRCVVHKPLRYLWVWCGGQDQLLQVLELSMHTAMASLSGKEHADAWDAFVSFLNHTEFAFAGRPAGWLLSWGQGWLLRHTGHAEEASGC